jgi:peptide/nickel transport system ATP-binding protein
MRPSIAHHAPAPDAPVLAVRDLCVEVLRPTGPARVVDGVSFEVRANEVFSVVGESGSGKSLTMLAVMGLLMSGRVRIAGGEILLKGRNLLTLSREELRRVRGKNISMIFQDPMTSLNPVLTIGSQIAEILRIHQADLSASAIRARVTDLLGLVGVPSPERRMRQYPHEFSGGMRQRAMIAMAIANEPDLLIADEPTTALDVTIQAQVMDVLAEARARTGASMILITHDLGLVAETADRVAVMYGGRLVETAGVEDLFARPRHPYAVGLLASLPRLTGDAGELYSIPGLPPGLDAPRSGCVFQARCGLSGGRSVCVDRAPTLDQAGAGHAVACHFSNETGRWAAAIATDRQSPSPMGLSS